MAMTSWWRFRARSEVLRAPLRYSRLPAAHTVEVIRKDDDFCGKSAVLENHMPSQAEGQQVLASSLLQALVESSGEFRFRDGREMELKGSAGTHQVFEVNLP